MTYFIRAKDVFGYYSLTVGSITSAVIKPDVPLAFTIVQQSDNLHFRVTPGPTIPSSGVEYEIRRGANWENGIFVTRFAGDRTTKLYPLVGEMTFWVKAVSTLGLYSTTALFYTIVAFSIQNRNFILQRDLPAEDWPGVKHDMIVTEDNHLTLTSGVNNGKYYADIRLPEKYVTRNWFDESLVAVPFDELTWETADFTWDDSRADAPWAPTGEIGNSHLDYRIARYQGLPAGAIDIIKLDGDLTSVEGEEPVESIGTAYDDAYYLPGLALGATSYHKYSIALGEEFFFTFHAKVSDPLEDDATLLTLLGSTISLRLGYDADTGCFFLVDHLNQRVDSEPVSFAPPDVLVFGINQTSSTRSLFVGVKKSETAFQGNAALTPLGEFDAVALYAAA